MCLRILLSKLKNIPLFFLQAIRHCCFLWLTFCFVLAYIIRLSRIRRLVYLVYLINTCLFQLFLFRRWSFRWNRFVGGFFPYDLISKECVYCPCFGWSEYNRNEPAGLKMFTNQYCNISVLVNSSGAIDILEHFDSFESVLRKNYTIIIVNKNNVWSMF